MMWTIGNLSKSALFRWMALMDRVDAMKHEIDQTCFAATRSSAVRNHCVRVWRQMCP